MYFCLFTKHLACYTKQFLTRLPNCIQCVTFNCNNNCTQFAMIHEEYKERKTHIKNGVEAANYLKRLKIQRKSLMVSISEVRYNEWSLPYYILIN